MLRVLIAAVAIDVLSEKRREFLGTVIGVVQVIR
jgi:hypothetical protein